MESARMAFARSRRAGWPAALASCDIEVFCAWRRLLCESMAKIAAASRAFSGFLADAATRCFHNNAISAAIVTNCINCPAHGPDPSHCGTIRGCQYSAKTSPMSDSFVFTSESVSEGHPDKIADQISDGILDAILAEDPRARVACETLVKTGVVIVAGEITTEAWVDFEQIVRETVVDIGYDDSKMGFDGHSCARSEERR